MAEFGQLRTFVAVVEAGGFAQAGRQLGMSAAAVTRAIAALEANLGVRLLHRTTRQTRLTEAGERFLQDAKRVLDELQEAVESMRNAHVYPQGELVLTAPLMFGRLHIAPLLRDFLTTHQKVRAKFLLMDRVVPLIEEGVDVALRIASLPDSSLIAVRVGAVRTVVVASPDYLAEHGVPQTPVDLVAHRAIGLVQIGGGLKHWHFTPAGNPQPQISMSVNNGDAAVEAALAGYGLARSLSYQVHEHIAAGRLQRVLEPYEPPPIPVQLVYPEARYAAAKVRAFVEFAAQRLRANPALREG